MDERDKGESNIRQRQESLARRVGQALDQLKPNEARDCPDAEIIAAYVEQALTPVETARWEGHFASCARCRNVLRVLAASSDAPLAEKEVSHLGELVSTARAPVSIDSRAAGTARPSRAAWRTRWLAPAIGVAAVLVVWFVMRPPWRATNQRSAQVLVAQAPKEELPPSAPPVLDQTLKEPQAKDREAQPTTEQERSLAKTLPQSQVANAPARTGTADTAPASAAQDKLSASAETSANAIPQKKELDRPLNGREIPAPAVPPPPPPPPAPQPRAKAASNLAAGESLQAETSSNAVANAPMPQKQAGAVQAQAGARRDESEKEISPALRSNARQQSQALTVFRSAQTGSSLLKAPASSVMWRVGRGGTIDGSNDAGKTWVSQMSPSQQDWLAGAPFSDTVCWLAGRKGAIARTVDGEHWDLIPPPVQAAASGGVQPDWIGISALDALSATVTSADGRTFSTSDGGMTWQRQ